jgi:hypothetical protein
MIGLALLVLLLLLGVGLFVYKNRQDRREVEKLLRETQAEDEAHEKSSIV